MSLIFIIIVTSCYTGIGIEQIMNQKYWFGTMWLCYALANVALYKAGAA